MVGLLYFATKFSRKSDYCGTAAGGTGGAPNLKKWYGYPVGVRIANDSESTIGWDFSYDTVAKIGNISWVEKSKTNAVSGRIVMDCVYWWSQEPNDGPRWHGKRCLMRLQTPGQGLNPQQNKPDMCLAADKTNNGDAKPLLIASCNRADTSQVKGFRLSPVPRVLTRSLRYGTCKQLRRNTLPLDATM